ncbi:MAG TPA: OB-fold nucleic acid binding domain-containing protein, partial [Candidatus Lustribacter sp.]|nr:OB-fold nucleic acid binding domain-containing protein [Candidatus Lustribacter sp.]
IYLGECRHMGINVLPPDVNSSIANFAAVGADIRFGLAAVRNVGVNVVEAIAVTRAQKGAFASFEDFIRKVPMVVCNKRTVESLIKAGAFDSLGDTRFGLFRVHEAYVDALVDEKRQEAIGQDSLFGGFGEATGPGAGDFVVLPTTPRTEWDKQALLAFEREMLGLYVSDHPLLGIEHILAQHADTSIVSLFGDEPKPDGTSVTIAGLITGLQIKRTKKGDLWAVATVEDLEGSIECLFFPASYIAVSAMLGHDVVCAVKGRVSSRDDSVSIIAQDLTLPDIVEGPRGPVVLTLPVARATSTVVERLRRVLREHPGGTEVHVRLVQPGRSTLMTLDDAFRVAASPALYGDLKALLGPACLGERVP